MSGEPVFLLQRHFKIYFSTSISYKVPKTYVLFCTSVQMLLRTENYFLTCVDRFNKKCKHSRRLAHFISLTLILKSRSHREEYPLLPFLRVIRSLVKWRLAFFLKHSIKSCQQNKYITGILKFISQPTALYVALTLLHVPATNRNHLQGAAVRGDTCSMLIRLVSIKNTSCAFGVCMRRVHGRCMILHNRYFLGC